MLRQLLRGAADETGATVVEFAVIASLLMLMILGIIEFGYASFAAAPPPRRHASGRGSRWCAYRSEGLRVVGRHDGRLHPGAGARPRRRATLVVTVSHPTGTRPRPTASRVSASYPSTTRITGLFPAMAISATAESVITY
jgi:hypothetical protein